MSLSLTLLIVFGVVFAAALFAGFLYEKELKEFERILVRYLKLRAKARKAGLSVEDYVKAKKMQKAAQSKNYSNVVSFDNWVA